MAEYAFEINIDKKLDEKLKNAEAKIEGLATASENTQKRIDDAFKRMAEGEGISAFMKKLQDIQAKMDGLDIGKNAAVAKVGNDAQASADKVNSLLQVIQGMTEALIEAKSASKDTADNMNKMADTDGLKDITKLLVAKMQELARLRSEMAKYNQPVTAGDSAGKWMTEAEYKDIQAKTNNLISSISALSEVKDKLKDDKGKAFKNYIADLSGASKATKAHIQDLEKLKSIIQERYTQEKQMEQSQRNELQSVNADAIVQDSEKALKNEKKYRDGMTALYKKMFDLIDAEEEKKRREGQKTHDLKVKQLQEENREQLKNYEDAISFSQKAKTGNRRKQAIDNLTEARKRLSSADSEYTEKLRYLNDEIQRHQKILKDATLSTDDVRKRDEERRKLEAKKDEDFAKARKKAEEKRKAELQLQTEERRKTPIGALAYASVATNIEEERKAIEYLKVARDKLSKSTYNYRDVLDTLNTAMQNLQKHIKEVGMTSSQIQDNQAVAAKKADDAMVASSDKRFARVLEDIRKEDELRKKSLKGVATSSGSQDSALAKYTEWTGLQKQILAADNKVKELTKSLNKYKEAQGGLKANSGLKGYYEKLINSSDKEIKALEASIAKWREKQQAIIDGSSVIEKNKKLMTFLSEEEGSDRSYSKSVLADMKLFYEEQERLAKAAAMAKQESEKKYLNSYEGSLQFANDAKNLEEEKEALEYLKNARQKLSKSDDEYKDKLEVLNQKIQDIQKNLKAATKTEQQLSDERIANAEKEEAAAERKRKKAEAQRKADERAAKAEADKRHSANPKAALDFSKQEAKSINDKIRAIQYLTIARNNLKNTDKDYYVTVRNLNEEIKRNQQEIDKVVGKSKKLQESHRNLMDTTGQLQRSLALLFSVSAIKGYINKLMEVRGEFELQQKSLESLLQNKDEADKLWNKTVELAVKSPFRVKELVTYTKQLAAYRVEADKLYGTNKMLADVSAGLGVDMNRLILAFGQVKAANFLRGTELRQFSEAGVNMLGELSKYFTELEGRLVSVGEVFQRVSKRMVSFTDVEKIFQRITSEGGAFYKMQEIQSETLKGMISNLRDSIDLMLNHIGKSNEGTLKGAVSAVKDFVDNWREAAWVLKRVVVAFTAVTVAMKLATLGNTDFVRSMFASNNAVGRSIILSAALKKSWQGLIAVGRGLMAAIPIAALMVGVGLLVDWYRESHKLQRQLAELNEELDEIYNKDSSNWERSVLTFKDLVVRLKDVNKHSLEHKRIIESLNSTYGEYLDYIVTEATTYDQLKSSIDGVVQAMTQKARANTYEKALSAVYEKTSQQALKMRDAIRKSLVEVVRANGGGFMQIKEREINDILSIYEKGVKDLSIVPDKTSLSSFGKLLSEYLNTDIIVKGDFDIDALRKYGAIVLEQKEKEEAIQKNINNLYGEASYSTKQMRIEIEKLNSDKAKEVELINAEKPEDIRRRLEDIEKKYGKEKIKIDLKYEFKKEGESDEEFFKRKSKMLSDRMSQFLSMYEDPVVKNLNDKILHNSSKLGKKYADMIYIDKNQYLTGIEQIAQSTAEAYESQQTIIKAQNALKKQGMVYNKEELENAQKSAAAYYYRLQIMGRLSLLDKKKGGGSDDVLSRRISLIKAAYDSYKKLRERFNQDESREQTLASYKDSFKKAFKGMKLSNVAEMDVTSIEGVIKALESLSPIAEKEGEEAKNTLEKVLSQYRAQLGIDVKIANDKELDRQMESLFSGYQLYVELEDMALPEDFLKNFFDIKATDLEDLKKAVKDAEPKYVGTPQEEKYKNMLERVYQIEQEAYVKRLQGLLKFISDSQAAILKAQNEGAFNIKIADQLFESGKIDTEQYVTMIRGVVNAVNEEVSDINLNAFKKSPEYIKAMGDLAAYSTREIKEMIAKLEDLIATSSGKMSAKELKEYRNAIGKMNEALDKNKMPWENNEISKFTEFLRLQKEYREELENQNELIAQRDMLDENIKTEKTKLSDLISQRDSGTGNTVEINKQIKQTEINIKNMTNQSVDFSNQINASSSKMGTLSQKMGALKGGASGAIAMVDMIVKGVYQSINATIEMFEELKGLAESFGKDVTTGKWSQASEAFKAIGDMNNKVMGSWESFKKGDMMGASVKAVGAVFSVIKGFNALHDNKREQKIIKQQKLVEKLTRAYEKLEKSVENAYSIDTFKKANYQAESNIKAQISSFNKMIALEEDKKKTDKDKVKEWKEQVEDLQEQLKELHEEQIQALGGFGDEASYKSAAEQFASSWYEAYKETGQGLDALQDTFADFMKNVVNKQLLFRGTERILKPLLQMIDEAVADAYLTKDELDGINQEFNNKTKEQLDQLYHAIVDELGVKPDGSGKLVGLQEGIQGITEETAKSIEAYMNSVRFFVADSNSKLTSLLESLTRDEVENPILSQLKIVANNTTAIRTLLDSLTAPHPTLAGRGLKVIF